MANYTGKELLFQVGNPLAAVPDVREVTIPEESPSIDTTTAGDDDGTVISEGIIYRNGCTLVFLDDSAGAGFDLFPPGAVLAAAFFPQGNSTGKPKHAGEIVVTKRDRPIQYNGLVVVTVGFDINGAWAKTTVAP